MRECDYCGERREFHGFEKDGKFMCKDCEEKLKKEQEKIGEKK